MLTQSNIVTKRLLLIATMVAMLVPAAALAKRKAKRRVLKPKISFGQAQGLIGKHFAAIKDYDEGALILRSEVKGAMQLLHKKGWTVADADDVLENTLDDNSFLARQLRSKRGKIFQKKISGTKSGYDFLERYSQMSDGRGSINTLIQDSRDGHDFLARLATGKGSKRMAKRFSRSKAGADFNKPTGKYYTLKSLLPRLQKSYALGQGLKAP